MFLIPCYKNLTLNDKDTVTFTVPDKKGEINI